MSGSRGYKIIPKINNNVIYIGLVLPNGDAREICRAILPDDKQLNDNCSCADEICAALRRRFRKSV